MYSIDTDRYHWSDRAACRDKPDMVWFFEKRKDLPLMMEALAVCQECPVKQQCLEASEQYDDRWYAVRGGLLPRQMLDSLRVEAKALMVEELRLKKQERELAILRAQGGRANMLSRGHCIHGHPTPSLEHVYVDKNGGLKCKQCTVTADAARRPPVGPATHCRRGHEWTEENTFIRKTDGRRNCRQCKRDWKAERRRAKIGA